VTNDVTTIRSSEHGKTQACTFKRFYPDFKVEFNYDSECFRSVLNTGARSGFIVKKSAYFHYP
jgi:hypothetical protein